MSLKQMDDPDWRILAREVFRPKKRHKVYADSEFAPEEVNYKSAQETAGKIEEQLRAEEEEGFVFPLTLAEARRRGQAKDRGSGGYCQGFGGGQSVV